MSFRKKYPLEQIYRTKFTPTVSLALLGLGLSGGSFLLLSFSCTLCLGAGPEIEAGVGVTDALDVASLSELFQETAGNGSVDLKFFD